MHGRNGSVKVDSVAIGTGLVTSFSYGETADTVENTGMGSANKTHEAGLVDGSGSLEVRFSQTETIYSDLLDALRAGSTVSLDLIPDSTDLVGDIIGWTGDCLITSFDYSQSHDATIDVSFSYQGVLTSYASA